MFDKVSFSGHEKFDCKIDWISRGLIEFNKCNMLFTNNKLEYSIEVLGLGGNMVKSLHFWLNALGLLEKNTLSNIGKIILEKDVFLENLDTIWLLHWNLVKNKSKATLYSLFFNYFYQYNFTKESLCQFVVAFLKKLDMSISENSIKFDIDVLLRMYDGYGDLGLFKDLQMLSRKDFSWNLNIGNTTNISDEVFLYILVDYIQMLDIKDSISIDEIQHSKLSIQKSLCLNENGLFMKINNIEHISNGALIYSESGGIRHIYLNKNLNTEDMLNRIYDV